MPAVALRPPQLPQRPEDVPARVEEGLVRAMLEAGRPMGQRFELVFQGLRLPGVRAGEGRPVLCVHGLGHDLSDWTPLFERRPEGFELFAFDLPGFGLADKPERRYPLPFLVEAIKEAAVLCREPPVIVGSSLGGHLALLAALDGLKVAGLSLAAPGGLQKIPLAGQMLARATFGRSAIKARRDKQVIDSSRGLFARPHPQSERIAARKLAIHRSPLRHINAHVVAAIVDDVFHHPVGERAQHIEAPMQLIYGDKDPLVPAKANLAIARQLSDDVHLFENIGHLPMLETPDAYADLVFTFARRAFASRDQRKQGAA